MTEHTIDREFNPHDRYPVTMITTTGYEYLVTTVTVRDCRILWLHGYRIGDGGLRMWTQRTPDEVIEPSLAVIRERLAGGR